MPVEIEKPRLRVIARREQLLGGPGHYRRLPADHERRDRAHRKATATPRIDTTAGCKGKQRAIEPAAVGRARRDDPALQNVLTIEVRALAIGRRCRVHDDGVLCPVEPVQIWHCGIERKKGIERQRWRPSIQHERLIPAQADPVGIANRCNSTKSVESPAKNNYEHARITALRARKLGDLGPGKQSA